MNIVFLRFAVLVFGVIFVMGCGERIGGMRPDNDARDYDQRLTSVASTAIPIIKAINQFYIEHHSFPHDTADLKPYLSPSQVIAQNAIDGWTYLLNENGDGFALSFKLGWDPCLVYESNGSGQHWVFSPGDGSPEKNILLKP